MSGLTDSQQEVARILFGLPESTGFALAGGSALVALGVIDRPTRDLDAFVAARAGDPSGDVGPLAATFSATLAGAGWDVEAVRQHRTGRSCGNGSPRGASTFDPPGWSGPGPGGTARTGPQTPRTPKPLARRTFRALTRGFASGTPNGIRTRAATLRGWCPRPLDDGGLRPTRRSAICGSDRSRRSVDLVRGGGLEPPITGPEPVVLPITPPPKGGALRRAPEHSSRGPPRRRKSDRTLPPPQ